MGEELYAVKWRYSERFPMNIPETKGLFYTLKEAREFAEWTRKDTGCGKTWIELIW